MFEALGLKVLLGFVGALALCIGLPETLGLVRALGWAFVLGLVLSLELAGLCSGSA